MDASFNLKLISLFDRARLVVKWMEKAEFVCSIVWYSEKMHTQVRICGWTASPGKTTPLYFVKYGHAVHWLVHAWATLKDDTLEPTTVVAVAKTATWTKSVDIPICPHIDITCYASNGPNQLTQDCLSHQMATTSKGGSRALKSGPHWEMHFSVQHSGAYLSRK